MKNLISILAALVLLMSVGVSVASADELVGPGIMYVNTPNGKTLNIRSEPNTGDNIIGHAKYGDALQVTSFQGAWACIYYTAAEDSIAWVQSRFLQWYEPGPKPTPKPEEDSEVKKELQSEEGIDPLRLEAHATRSSGWVNMRKSPSKTTKRIQTCPDGAELIAFAETTNWYHVTDPVTGNSGYIRKDFLKAIPVEEPAVDETTRIGTLNVNGEFMLQGKIPEGYKLQVMANQNTRIIAALIAEDTKSPQMMLTIAFDEMFADVERMNDMSAEDIETLKASFTDMNEVEFSEAVTAAGTKLLIAKETGSDEDFASIITLYKGYSVEFVLSPNPDAADQALTDDQIQKGIDFLSDLEFIPAN